MFSARLYGVVASMSAMTSCIAMQEGLTQDERELQQAFKEFHDSAEKARIDNYKPVKKAYSEHPAEAKQIAALEQNMKGKINCANSTAFTSFQRKDFDAEAKAIQKKIEKIQASIGITEEHRKTERDNVRTGAKIDQIIALCPNNAYAKAVKEMAEAAGLDISKTGIFYGTSSSENRLRQEGYTEEENLPNGWIRLSRPSHLPSYVKGKIVITCGDWHIGEAAPRVIFVHTVETAEQAARREDIAKRKAKERAYKESVSKSIEEQLRKKAGNATEDTKLKTDRDVIYTLCAKREDEHLNVYNKVKADERIGYASALKDHLLHQLDKDLEVRIRHEDKMARVDELQYERDLIVLEYTKKIQKVEHLIEDILKELNVSKEEYQKSLESIRQRSYLPSIADLESSAKDNEYLKVMKEFCNLHNFDIASTRILGKNETGAGFVEYPPIEMEHGIAFYAAKYDHSRMEGLAIKGGVILKVTRLFVEESDPNARNITRRKPLMTFQILDLSAAPNVIAEAKIEYEKKKKKRRERAR